MQHVKQKLENVFKTIEQQRMQDMPVCNPALRVKAIGFEQWNEYYFGVMITPWFMNLMLLPCQSGQDHQHRSGDKQFHHFPSGSYEFVIGEEDELGIYQACSLFSPVFEFGDQHTAEATATSILDEIMRVDNYHQLDDSTRTANQQADERQQTAPLSRRDFLRGMITGREGQQHGN